MDKPDLDKLRERATDGKRKGLVLGAICLEAEDVLWLLDEIERLTDELERVSHQNEVLTKACFEHRDTALLARADRDAAVRVVSELPDDVVNAACERVLHVLLAESGRSGEEK